MLFILYLIYPFLLGNLGDKYTNHLKQQYFRKEPFYKKNEMRNPHTLIQSSVCPTSKTMSLQRVRSGDYGANTSVSFALFPMCYYHYLYIIDC